MRSSGESERFMTKHIAIIEGNHSGLVRHKDGAIYGAAEGFADCLRALEQGLRFTIIRPHFDEHIFHDDLLAGCDGVVFTGSANQWSADDARGAPAREVMGLALASGKPVFGSCYGMQLAVAVLGGENRSHPIATEFAIARDISLTQAGAEHPLYHGKAARFDARCMHRDEVARLPKGAISLATNAHSRHQAMAYEQEGVCFWGVQYHPELQFHDIANYIEKNDVDSFADARIFAQSLSLDADLAEITADFRRLSEECDEGLINKYQLSEALTNSASHRCELLNFFKLLSL